MTHKQARDFVLKIKYVSYEEAVKMVFELHKPKPKPDYKWIKQINQKT